MYNKILTARNLLFSYEGCLYYQNHNRISNHFIFMVNLEHCIYYKGLENFNELIHIRQKFKLSLWDRNIDVKENDNIILLPMLYSAVYLSELSFFAPVFEVLYNCVS